MPRLLAAMVLAGLLVGCGPKDGPRLPAGGPAPAASAPAASATTPTSTPGAPGPEGTPPAGAAHSEPAGEGDACCPAGGDAAGAGHECCCGTLKPGCKCGHCVGAVPVCHCKHEKKPDEGADR